MTNFICVRCGVQFAESAAPPDGCPICQDPRQYVGPNGQEWTSLAALASTSRNVVRPIEPGMSGYFHGADFRDRPACHAP